MTSFAIKNEIPFGVRLQRHLMTLIVLLSLFVFVHLNHVLLPMITIDLFFLYLVYFIFFVPHLITPLRIVCVGLVFDAVFLSPLGVTSFISLMTFGVLMLRRHVWQHLNVLQLWLRLGAMYGAVSIAKVLGQYLVQDYVKKDFYFLPVDFIYTTACLPFVFQLLRYFYLKTMVHAHVQ